MGLTHLSILHNFSLKIGLHLGYIEMLNDGRVASLGFFKDNICTTRINKEKKFEIKFQVLPKFAQILLDYKVSIFQEYRKNNQIQVNILPFS